MPKYQASAFACAAPAAKPCCMSDGTPALTAKRACVIGAGFGGLAHFWERDGFTFDAGPTAITDPDGLYELWALSGRHMADDIELLPVSPFYRLMWPDGATFDYSNDERTLRNELARISPEDIAGYDDFLKFSERAYRDAYLKLGRMPFPDLASMC